MGAIRNILAIIGLLAIGGAAYMYSKVGGDINAFAQLDSGARAVYTEMWQKLKESGNTADATVWVYPLADGVSREDAEESMQSAAIEHNIKDVGKLPLSEQVELQTGEKQRFLKIYQYCKPTIAMKMVEYSDAFSAYLPCRIAMVQGKDGKYRLYALNMDMMIYGGKTLPPELMKSALEVKETILDIMKRGAAGDF